MKILGFETNAYKRAFEAYGKQKDSEAGGRLIQADKDIILKIVNAFKDTSRKNIDICSNCSEGLSVWQD